MPGLFKNNKRKRVTVDSSFADANDTVWHSTPVDTVNAEPEVAGSGDDDGGGSTTSSSMLSPVLQNHNEKEKNRDGVCLTPGPFNEFGTGAVFKTPNVPKTKRKKPNPALVELSEDIIDLVADTNVEQQTQLPPGHVTLAPEEPVVINPPSGHAYFTKVLLDAGFILSIPKNHLRVDVTAFRESLNRWIKDNTNEESRIEDNATKFKKATAKFFSDRSNLKHSCTTTLSTKDIIQPSLLACLVGVKLLQCTVVKSILPSLSESCLGNSHEDHDAVYTIMNQLKWLPTLEDGKNLTSQILDLLEIASIPAQKHIIYFLPEIFFPEFHADLIPKLLEIFAMGTQVNVAILDCFASLVLPESDCIEIRRSAVEQMTTAPLKDLPSYFSFLFRVDTPDIQLEEGIREMREKLNFERPPTSSDDAAQIEILERLRFCVTVNELIGKIWMNTLKDDLQCDVDWKPLDLLMILVFLEIRTKGADILLSQLFQRPNLASSLFGSLIDTCKQMLHQLFSVIVTFLDSMMRSKVSKYEEATSAISKLLFVGLGPITAQHLTMNLIQVLISGHPNCRNTVLNVFNSIAETDARKLLHFSHFFMGALVYIMKYPPRQMQSLMNILATLAYTTSSDGLEENQFTSEFMILLRKQITMNCVRTKCFGVLGAVAAVRQLTRLQHPDAENRIDGLLALAWSSVENDDDACCILFDELIPCVYELPKDICEQLRDIIKKRFEKLWSIEQPEGVVDNYSGELSDLKLEPTFDANLELEQDRIMLTLESKHLQISPLVIPSHFRIMAELENIVENGDLSGIDILVGCPILMPKFGFYYKLDNLDHLPYNQRVKLGQYLVISINYFRETISSFVNCRDLELKLKVWLRLQHIVELQRILIRHFDTFPNLPPAYCSDKTFEDTPIEWGFQAGASTSAAAKKNEEKDKTKKRKVIKKTLKKKRKREDSDDEESDGDDMPSPEKSMSMEKRNTESDIQPKQICRLLRRFDKKVFKLLKAPFTFNYHYDFDNILKNLSSATQSDAGAQLQQLEPSTLILLLSDLKNQAEEKLFKLNLLTVNKNLLSYLRHLISSIIDAMEGEVVDREKTDSGSSCMVLLLQIFILYLEAVRKHKDKREMMDILFTNFANDSNEDSKESDTVKFFQRISNIEYFNEVCAYENVRALNLLFKESSSSDVNEVIENILKVYLQRKWKLKSSILSYFLKTWFLVGHSPFSVVKELLDSLLSISDNEDVLDNTLYQSCNKANFYMWYSSIFSCFAQHVYKVGRRRGDFRHSISIWVDSMPYFNRLVAVSQKLQKSSILVPLLKHSRVYVDAFISGGISLLPEFYRKDVQGAQKFIKSFQISTRKIQNICEHSKVTKDDALLKYVPLMKKTLETLLFRTRAVVAHIAPDAFWLGALKHKNLDGIEIGSQPFAGSADVTEDSEVLEESEEVNASEEENGNDSDSIADDSSDDS